MKVLLLIFVILIQCSFLFGQDGSNMSYIEIEKVDKSFVGRKLHIDFNQRSFAAFDSKRYLDTKIINVNDKPIKFIEHREDDGFNNWFARQYLESVEDFDGLKLRITEFELLKITEKDILVTGFFVFVNEKEQVLPEKSFTKALSFKKKEIVELLFKAKD